MTKQGFSTDTSPSLLLRVRDPNDAEAWDQFLQIYTSIVRSYCFQRRIQASDVDDIVQEVMTAVSRGIRNFDYDPNKGRFRSWLGTVTANRIKAFFNRESRRNSHVVTDQTESGRMEGPWSDPDSEWTEIFSQRIFQLACNRIRGDFTDRTWECFVATWIRNESAPETAEKLQIPIHSVYVNKSRILKRLEKEVRLLAEDVPIPPGS